jgi:hypothetical protein
MRFDALRGLLRVTRIAAAGGHEPYQMRVVADTRMQDRWVRKGREGRKKTPVHRRWKAASRLIRSIMGEPMRCLELRSGFSFAHFASFADPMRFDALRGLLHTTRIAGLRRRA